MKYLLLLSIFPILISCGKRTMNTQKPTDQEIKIAIDVEIENESHKDDFVDIINCAWDNIECCLACVYVYKTYNVYKCVPGSGYNE